MHLQAFTSQVIADLILIHDERISHYTSSMRNNPAMPGDIRSVTERIVEESIKCKNQLEKRLDKHPGSFGEVFMAWEQSRKPVPGSPNKNILELYAHDELVLTNTYSLAISLLTESALLDLLKKQQQKMKDTYFLVQQFHDAQ